MKTKPQERLNALERRLTNHMSTLAYLIATKGVDSVWGSDEMSCYRNALNIWENGYFVLYGDFPEKYPHPVDFVKSFEVEVGQAS